MFHYKSLNTLIISVIFFSFGFVPQLAVAVDEESYASYAAARENECQGVYDPYESFNRKIFMFNGIMDAIILRPIAITYNKVTNNFVRTRVNNSLSNLREPLTMVNYLFQGRPADSAKSFWRFIINSTFGLVGMYDVAAGFDLKTDPQTLSSTLAYYGVGPGPYIVLPVFGGMSARSMTAPLFSSSAFNPVKYYLHSDAKMVASITGTIALRDSIMPFTDHVTKYSQDPYVTMRDSYYQNSESKMVYPDNFSCPEVK